MSIFSKVLVYTLVLALIAAIGLWVMGGSQNESEGSVEIKASPEEVFKVLIEPAQRQKWLWNVTNVEMKSRPPIAPNSTYLSQHLEKGKTFETNDQVLQMVPPEWLSIRMGSVSSNLVTMFKLAPAGSQTSLKYKVSQTPTNLFRLLAPLRKVDLQGRVDEELIRIKRLVEQSNQAGENQPPAVEPGEENPAEAQPPLKGSES
ncbi:MAG: SRPBCC domain-containing protein [Planctomycetota bacterium]